MTIDRCVYVMPAKLEDTAGCHDSCGTQLVSFQLAVLSQLVKQRFPNNCTTLTTYRLLDKVMRSIYLKKQEADSSAALMEDLRKWYLEKQLKQVRISRLLCTRHCGGCHGKH